MNSTNALKKKKNRKEELIQASIQLQKIDEEKHWNFQKAGDFSTNQWTYSYTQVFFSGQALDSVWPSPRRMITAVGWYLSLGSRISYHFQNLSHTRPVLGHKRDASHGDVQKRLQLLLRCLIARGRVVPGLSLLLANRPNPLGNVRAVLQDKVLERSFPREELQEEDAEAVHISRLRGRPPDVAALWGSVEERGRARLFVWVGVSEWSEAIIC